MYLPFGLRSNMFKWLVDKLIEWLDTTNNAKPRPRPKKPKK